MTFTYSADQLNGFPKSGVYQVRLLLRDTLSCNAQFQDEEIQCFLGMRATIYGAAAECCRALATGMSRSVNIVAGTTHISYSDLAKAYNLRAAYFEHMAAANGAAMPYAGGISVIDKENQEQNSDRVPPQFAIGMTDNVSPVPPVGIETEDEASLGSVGGP